MVAWVGLVFETARPGPAAAGGDPYVRPGSTVEATDTLRPSLARPQYVTDVAQPLT